LSRAFAGSVYQLLREIGVKIPGEVGFASIDVAEPPRPKPGWWTVISGRMRP
jgi:hypothetical protein